MNSIFTVKRNRRLENHVGCPRRVREQTVCPEHHQGGVWRFLPRHCQQFRAVTCFKERQFGHEKQLYSMLSGRADDEVWSDGHEDLDWSVSRRILQWGVCYTPRPYPRVKGDGLMSVGPVFRAVTHTRNGRVLWSANLYLPIKTFQGQ